MTPIVTPPRTASSPRRALFALATGYFGSAATALLVVAVGRLVASAHPDSATWLMVGIVTGSAAVAGLAVAERAVATDTGTLLRRFAGVMLLGGFAVMLVLLGLYCFPAVQSAASPSFLKAAGPVVALLFFPVLLLAMGPRMAAGAAADRALMVAAVSTLGAITGWALVGGPSALLSPVSAVAASAVLVEGVGLTVSWACLRGVRHRTAAGAVVAATVSIALLIAAELGGGDGTITIGSL